MSQDGGHLGASAAVRELRARRLLRLLQEQARHQTCARNRTSDHQVSRAWRELDVLLRRRRDVRSRLIISLPRLRGRVRVGAQAARVPSESGVLVSITSPNRWTVSMPSYSATARSAGMSSVIFR